MPRRLLTLSLHEYHPRHTLRVDTGSVMRKTFLLLALLALGLPVAGLASQATGEGTLSVEDGHGKVTIQARGGVIGRLDRGTVTIFDLTPEDANVPVVFGDDQPVVLVGENGIQVHGYRHALPRHRRPLPHRDPGPRDRSLRRRQGLRLDQGRPRPDPACTRSTAPTAGRTARRCKLLPEVEKRFLLEAAAPSRREKRGPPRGQRMTAGAQTILVVEDEASIASFVSLYLKNAGYDVRAVTTGNAALTQVASEQPALIILDLMLPDIDGIEICRRVRKTSDVPILMLTARDEDVDKIIGLEVGADDYLTKPFNPRELVARVKSVLRRSAPERRRDVEEELHHGDLSINAGRREVKVGEEEIQLAPKEFDLLWELLDHKGLVLTRDQLLERVWGYTFAGDTRTVDVHVRQLRRKLGDASPIVTVWGVGYKVGPDRAPAPAA